MRSRILSATLLLLSAPPAAAGPSVTVYSRDLGLVRETRRLDLAAARDTVRLDDVSRRLDVSSVRLVPAGGARVTRLAFRFDLASGDQVLDRAVGSRVSVAVRGNQVVAGTLVAADGSWLTVREDAGALHAVARTSVEDVRIADPPAGFSLRPTLEAVIEGGRRGPVDAELSYLTGGLSWSAEHTVARTGETAASWSTAVTVENTTGRDYADARLKLVAGDPSRDAPAPYPRPMREGAALMSAPAEGPDLKEQAFSEYHLYALDRPATLRDRETQTLTMLEPRAIAVTPRYVYRGGDPRGVKIQLEARNERAAGLGVPLPGGRVRIYEADADGDVHLAGETRIVHTAEGEKLTLDVGWAFDLVAERREVSSRRLSNREREYEIEIKLRNRKKTGVTIVVEESAGGNTDIFRKSHDFTRKDAATIEFELAVPPGREVVVTYAARVTY